MSISGSADSVETQLSFEATVSTQLSAESFEVLRIIDRDDGAGDWRLVEVGQRKTR